MYYLHISPRPVTASVLGTCHPTLFELLFAFFIKKISSHLALFVLLIACITACGESRKTLPARLVSVTDGDSINVVLQDKETEIRLYGIDAPEIRQTHGKESAQALKELLASRKLTVTPVTEDSYHRIVALIFADRTNVGAAMVANGQAWVYTKYCTESFCIRWQKNEKKARKAKRGLWRDTSPQAPWEWRTTQRWKQAVTIPEIPKTIGMAYSGNVKSRVFHRSTCKDYHCKNCTQFFTDRKQALAAGFKPCGICKP